MANGITAHLSHLRATQARYRDSTCALLSPAFSGSGATRALAWTQVATGVPCRIQPRRDGGRGEAAPVREPFDQSFDFYFAWDLATAIGPQWRAVVAGRTYEFETAIDRGTYMTAQRIRAFEVI